MTSTELHHEPMGRRLKRLREAAGYSLSDLARATGTSKGYLSGIESGAKGGELGMTLACRISEQLGVTVRELAGRSAPSPEACAHASLTYDPCSSRATCRRCAQQFVAVEQS